MWHKSLQEVSDTSVTSSSSSDDDDSEDISKSHIEKVYSKLEGLTFEGTFEGYVETGSTKRPTYLVTDKAPNGVLSRICHKMKRKRIWKGITTSGDMHVLYGTQDSVEHKKDGMYHIPVGGVQVIVSDRLILNQAMVNITVE